MKLSFFHRKMFSPAHRTLVDIANVVHLDPTTVQVSGCVIPQKGHQQMAESHPQLLALFLSFVASNFESLETVIRREQTDPYISLPKFAGLDRLPDASLEDPMSLSYMISSLMGQGEPQQRMLVWLGRGCSTFEVQTEPYQQNYGFGNHWDTCSIFFFLDQFIKS